MPSRQMGKTKTEICAMLGISMETLDAYIDAVNKEESKRREEK